MLYNAFITGLAMLVIALIFWAVWQCPIMPGLETGGHPHVPFFAE